MARNPEDWLRFTRWWNFGQGEQTGEKIEEKKERKELDSDEDGELMTK